MIRIPEQGKPPIPPPITPKDVGKEAKPEEERGGKQIKPVILSGHDSIGRGPEMDVHGIAVRLAALATEAKEKEISANEFEKILEEVIMLTGLKDPQAALEEANKKLQKEIEIELQKIKDNSDLMEEAEDWQRFGDLLYQMNEGQVDSFLGLLKDTIREL